MKNNFFLAVLLLGAVLFAIEEVVLTHDPLGIFWVRNLVVHLASVIIVMLFVFFVFRKEHKKTLEEIKARHQAELELNTLQGLVPICMYCKGIRDDAGAWHQLEAYISARTPARFSHGICPGCKPKMFMKNGE